MSKNKRLAIIVILNILMLTTLLSGCTKDPVRITPETATDYDVSIFFGGIEDPIEIDEMINKFNKDTGISIEAIITDDKEDDQRYLNRILDSSTPPTAFISDDQNGEILRSKGFILNLENEDAGIGSESYPYKVDGYGLVIDKRIIPEISGSSDTDAFIADMKAADYYEWNTFIQKLNEYINNDKNGSYELHKNTYSFPDKKGELISKVNGIFAFPAADYSVSLRKLMNIAFSNSKLSPQNSVELDTAEFLYSLAAYYDLLNTMTSNIAGRFAPSIRGNDLINEEKFGIPNAMDIFARGSAVFMIAGNEDYAEISNNNASQANNLTLFPIKMPINNGNSAMINGRLINSSIPISASYSLYVNALADQEQQDMAIEFVKWLPTYREENINAIDKATIDYWLEGNVWTSNLDGTSIPPFMSAVENDRLLDEFLKMTNWNSTLRASFNELLTNTWLESR